MCEKGTSGGRVPYVRTARVHIAVTWPVTRVGLAVAFAAGTTVEVGTPVAAVGVVVRSVMEAGVTVGVSVAGRVADATGITAVSVTGIDVSVGRAVRVWATAVLNNASEVACESTVGPVPGVGVKPGSWLQAPSNKARLKPRTTTVFFIMPSFGLCLADNLHELRYDIS